MDAAFAAPFDLQVEFLARKLDLPTATWRDIRHAAHDTGFVVAGATKADLLADLHGAVLKAARDGRGIEDFRRDFGRIVAERGWTGWTGQGTAAGVAWRTKVIYQANMTTSHAAGRWAQINDPDLAQIMPYITYHHADGVLHPRPLHLAWNGLTLPKGHPFFRTHAAPNGWGCHCWLSAASGRDYERAKAAGKTEPPAGWDEIDPKTGAPVGIDKGWAYNPGASRMEELQQFVATKAAALPEPLGRALSADLRDLPALPPDARYVGVVGQGFRRAIDSGLASIPDKVRQAVADQGYTVAAGPTLLDIAPRLATASPPRGYPAWATWAHADGVTLGREKIIAVAESALLMDGRRALTPPPRIGALLRHEHGHALDRLFGAGNSPAFIAAYEADAESLMKRLAAPGVNEGIANDMRYLLQAGQAGREEAFAELFAELHGGGTAPYLHLGREMPRSRDAVRSIIDAFLQRGALP